MNRIISVTDNCAKGGETEEEGRNLLRREGPLEQDTAIRGALVQGPDDKWRSVLEEKQRDECLEVATS